MRLSLRQFAERAMQIEQEPLDEQARATIAAAHTASIVRRFEEGRDFTGAALAPNAPSTLRQKRREGYGSTPFTRTGASRRQVTVQIDGNREVQTIGTPWSKAVHDGGEFTVRRRGIAPRTARMAKAIKARTQAHEKRLMAAQGDNRRYTARRGADARARHAEERRGMGYFRRITGVYELTDKHRNAISLGLRAGRMMAAFGLKRRPAKDSWTVTLKSRRTLGVSTEDVQIIERAFAQGVRRRLGRNV